MVTKLIKSANAVRKGGAMNKRNSDAVLYKFKVEIYVSAEDIGKAAMAVKHAIDNAEGIHGYRRLGAEEITVQEDA